MLGHKSQFLCTYRLVFTDFLAGLQDGDMCSLPPPPPKKLDDKHKEKLQKYFKGIKSQKISRNFEPVRFSYTTRNFIKISPSTQKNVQIL